MDYEFYRGDDQFSVYEVWNSDLPKPKKRFYVVEHMGEYQISSCVYGDMPTSGRWVSNLTASGIQYVANARTLNGALSAYYRCKKERKEYEMGIK